MTWASSGKGHTRRSDTGIVEVLEKRVPGCS